MEPWVVVTAPAGITYIGETSGRIRKVDAAGVISTFVTLDAPIYSMARDSASGVLYAGTYDSIVWRIDTSGNVTKYAGGGTSFAEGIAATKAFFYPFGLAVDGQGRLLIADYYFNNVRGVKDGIIRTVAGTGEMDSTGDGGLATAAAVDSPSAITIDASGNLLIAEWAKIRKVTPQGIISTVAGTGRWGYGGDSGPATSARMSPDSIAADNDGNIYFGQSAYLVIRKIGTDGTVTTIAGTGNSGFSGDGGPPITARFGLPTNLAVEDAGGLLVADYTNARVRRITTKIVTAAGSAHFRGDNGPALDAVLWQPQFGMYAPDGHLHFSDSMNRRIRGISPEGVIKTTAGNGGSGDASENVAATSSTASYVQALTMDPQGNIVYADGGAVRKIGSDGKVVTIAGSTTDTGDSGDGGDPLAATFDSPSGFAWDQAGNLYIADYGNNRIRKLATDGKLYAFAGTGYWGQSGDNGPATDADIEAPNALAMDSDGNLYVLAGSDQIRKIGPDGVITTVLTSGIGQTLDTTPRPVNAVDVESISSITVDSTGTLYFAMPGGIGAVKNGKAWRVAGSDAPGAVAGDGGAAMAATFGRGLTIQAGADRSIVVSEGFNQKVRVLRLAEPQLLQKVSGDGQSAAPGSPLGSLLAVTVKALGGIPAALVPVTFTVTSGTATLDPATVMTDATGTAQTAVTLGATEGEVKITVTVAGLTPVVFTAKAVTTSSPDQPTVSEGGITGAALSVPPVKTISPNAIVTVWGQNFIAEGTQRRLSPEDLVDGRIPTVLGGLCVLFGGERAPIFDIYPGQINVQVPGVAPGTTVDVKVVRNCGQADEVASTPVKVDVTTASPEFFAFSARSDGHVPVAARHNPSNVIVGPEGAYGEASQPATPGSIVTVYGTGFGLTYPAFAPGELPNAAASPSATATVTLGGVTLTPADVLYVGVTPGSAGLYQLNLRVPDNVPDGEQELILKIGDKTTPNGPYLLIRR
jgi:uncharacterized protein (TIGR03437 family)